MYFFTRKVKYHRSEGGVTLLVSEVDLLDRSCINIYEN